MNNIIPNYPDNAEEESLQKKLGFEYPGFSNDWVCLFSDPERIDEYITAYETLDLTSYEKYTLIDLILNSLTDAIEASENEVAYTEKVCELIRKDLAFYKNMVLYWSCLDNENNIEDCFGVTPFMRVLLREMMESGIIEEGLLDF